MEPDGGGGGILGAIGSHVLDLLDFWLGPVAAVGARLTTSIPELPDGDGVLRPVESDDGADLWLTFASGVTGTVSLTTMADRYRGFHWEIHGTEGSLWIDPAGDLFAARRGGDPARLSEPDPLGPDPVLDGSLWACGFVHAARDLRDHLLGKTPAPHLATFTDGWRTQRVLDTARRAAGAAAVLEVPGA